MAAVPLDGSEQRQDLGDGYGITVPGRTGTGQLLAGGPTGRDELDAALDRAEMRRRAVVQASISGITSVSGALEALVARLGPSILLEAPPPPPDAGQLVLAVDDLGGSSWHFREQAPAAIGATFDPDAQLFVIPIRGGPQGGVRAAIGRMLLQVLVYPLSDRVLGPICEHFAARWEQRNRPHAIRTFTPGNYGEPAAPGWTDADWDRVGAGRALLFVHGGHSTATAAFGSLPQDTMQQLCDRYGQRVFAFNHPTLTVDPAANALWFLDQIPERVRLDLDIIAHSRGGIVARELTHPIGGPRPDRPWRLRPGAIVFVGVPNRGTPLFDANYMSQMLDRLTTAASALPSGPVAELFDGLIFAVKLMAHGLLAGVPGLAALVPGGAFLRSLNEPGTSELEFHAIAADYDPPIDGPLFQIIKRRVWNVAADAVFQEPNDLVVPTDGVGGAIGGAGFPIDAADCLLYSADRGVMHTTYFRQREVSEKLLSWLQPESVAERRNDREWQGTLEDINARQGWDTLRYFKADLERTVAAVRQALVETGALIRESSLWLPGSWRITAEIPLKPSDLTTLEIVVETPATGASIRCLGVFGTPEVPERTRLYERIIDRVSWSLGETPTLAEPTRPER